MNKFNFKIEITGSKSLPMYDDHPDLATYERYGYGLSFYIEDTLCAAMAYAEKLCASELKTKSLYDDDYEDECFDYLYDENEYLINVNHSLNGPTCHSFNGAT